jgi:hypothetical protein
MPKPNSIKRWKKIKQQFKEMLHEKTPVGQVQPSSANVVGKLAEQWCLSEDRIREILNMELDEDSQQPELFN